MGTLEINELIKQIRKELSIINRETDIFFVEEVNLELNFTIDGNIDGGFNIGVVTLGSNVKEERVQKIALKLSPIISKDELLKGLPKEKLDEIKEVSSNILFKGSRTKG